MVHHTAAKKKKITSAPTTEGIIAYAAAFFADLKQFKNKA